MAKNTNVFAEALRGVANEIRSRTDSVAAKDQLQFDEERLSKGEHLSFRWDAMSDQEKRDYISTNGVDVTIKNLKKGSGTL